MKKRISLATPHMGGGEQKYIKEAFDTNWIAPLGNNVNCFEEELAQYVGVARGTALVSGTSAIHMALRAADVGPGDIVFCSSLTFSASANPIRYQGAVPVFIDSEYETWNMDPKALARAFEKYPQAKAVVVVDLYGIPAKWKEIQEICSLHNAVIIEDAAEALGSVYCGKQCGTFGKYGAFSFNGNKIITTSGGGMLVSDDGERIDKVRFWATQAKENERYYQHMELGYNYRMSNIVAGIGRGQLEVLDQRVEQKNNIFKTYAEGLSDIDGISMMPTPADCAPNSWLSCILLDKDCPVKPIDIILALEAENIETRHIWKPMHMQPYYEDCDFVSVQDCGSVGEDIFNRGVCLPSDTKMTAEEQAQVIACIRNVFSKTSE